MLISGMRRALVQFTLLIGYVALIRSVDFASIELFICRLRLPYSRPQHMLRAVSVFSCFCPPRSLFGSTESQNTHLETGCNWLTDALPSMGYPMDSLSGISEETVAAEGRRLVLARGNHSGTSVRSQTGYSSRYRRAASNQIVRVARTTLIPSVWMESQSNQR